MLSYTCKTAIKAVIYLASKFEKGENAGIKEIAEYIDASEHTVGKLLQTLVRQRIINSVKGPSGGFYISREQIKQPIITIVEAIDGKQVFKECGLGLSKCSAAHPCPIHNEYKEARNLVEKLFTQKKVADLREPVNSGMAYLFG
ncbi:MAG: Rrf2 family transcriptional regulator [Chitinophagaceae bacterium]|nr:Rrf2 family transcriptional regulator [Chitinophagaceae bacterium]